MLTDFTHSWSSYSSHELLLYECPRYNSQTPSVSPTSRLQEKISSLGDVHLPHQLLVLSHVLAHLTHCGNMYNTYCLLEVHLIQSPVAFIQSYISWAQTNFTSSADVH